MKKYALFIGIDHYDDGGITPLRCCAHDARELAGVFKHKLGFATTVLTHEELKHGQSVTHELRRIGKLVAEGDVFVLFFAGHGQKVGESDPDQLFLLPLVDAQVLQQGLVPGEGVLPFKALCAQTDGWAGVQRAFIFDACRTPLLLRDANSRDAAQLTRFDGEAVYRAIAAGPQPSGVKAASLVTFNSCLDQQRAEELPNYQGGHGLGHGLFTAALLETLAEYDAAGKSVVLDDELTASVATRMQALVRAHSARDTPQRPLRVGAEVRLFEAKRADAASAHWLAQFERQLAAGQLDKPLGDNCRDSLNQLAGYAGLADLQARLQAALDAREAEDEARMEAKVTAKVAALLAAQATKAGPVAAQSVPVAPVVMATPGKPSTPPAAVTAPGAASVSGENHGLALVVIVVLLFGIGLLFPQGKWGDVAPSASVLMSAPPAADEAVASVQASAPASAPLPSPARVDALTSAPASAPASAPLPSPAPPPSIGSAFQDNLSNGGKGPVMVVLPSGSFQIGTNNHEPDEKGGPRITIAKPFAMGKFELTVGEYLACVAAKGCPEPKWREAGSEYHYQTGRYDWYRKLGAALTGDNYPIVGISWYDAQTYVKWLNQNKATDSLVGEYFIPSEAQWEYAARDGKEGKQYGFGDDSKQLADYAWYEKNSDRKPHAVGGKKVSDYGLHDMHGNVWEWVQDWYHDNYSDMPADGSAWEDGSVIDDKQRILRGGSWYNGYLADLRAARRYRITHTNRDNNIGVRVARTLP